MANTMEAFVHVRAVDTIGHFPYFAWSGKEATMRDQIKLLYKYGFLPFTAITQGGIYSAILQHMGPQNTVTEASQTRQFDPTVFTVPFCNIH